jgi:hypothetical protein
MFDLFLTSKKGSVTRIEGNTSCLAEYVASVVYVISWNERGEELKSAYLSFLPSWCVRGEEGSRFGKKREGRGCYRVMALVQKCTQVNIIVSSIRRGKTHMIRKERERTERDLGITTR